jgi:short-subunit dehydrogenase
VPAGSRVAACIAAEPDLALLVNNAGFGHCGLFWESDLAVLEAMHRLHVLAILGLTHQAGSAVTVQAVCPGYTHSEFHDLLGDDRRRLAPAFLWTTAAEVVDASLHAVGSGPLLVIPVWPHRWLIAVLTRLPFGLKLWLEAPRGHRPI